MAEQIIILPKPFSRVALSLVFWIWSAAGVCAPVPAGEHERPTLLWAAHVIDRGVSSKNLRTNPLENGFAGITFLDNKHLLVREVRLTGELSSRANLETSSGFRLHASVLDASSGRAELTQEWGTRARDSSIWVTSGGILVRTGEVMRFYSPDFVEL
jgi:hypothetical protein